MTRIPKKGMLTKTLIYVSIGVVLFVILLFQARKIFSVFG